MALRYGNYLKDLSLSLFSSTLLILSFPDFDLGFLAYLGLLPLLVAINCRSLIHGFLLSLICGMVFFMGIFYWILEVPKYTLFHHGLLAIYLGSYFAFFGLMFNFVSTRWGTKLALFAAPFIWVSLEWIRSNLSFLALPWGLLAHSQYRYPLVIQIASVAGTYSISFLIVMANAALASLFLLRLKPPLPQINPPASPLPAGRQALEKRGICFNLPFLKGGREGLKGKKYLLAITVSLLLFTLVYGYFTITNTITGNKVKISLVQGNIEQSKKWDQRYAEEIMQVYADLTQQVSEGHPALIIWPETATPGSIRMNPNLFAQLISIVRNAGTYLLVGSAQNQKFDQKEAQGLKYLNSAFLIRPDPKIARRQRYDKIRLFPFGEYLPYKDVIPWSIINVRESSEYAPGKEFTVFEHPACRFGVTICWENVFPNLFRQFVRHGAQVMINITNEAHFGKTAAPHQLACISVFRAVENRIFVVRCANTGVSCIIDSYGRIVDWIKDEKGQDIFIRGTLTGWIIPLDSKTIYTRFGDWFVWVAVIGSLVFLLGAWGKERQPSIVNIPFRKVLFMLLFVNKEIKIRRWCMRLNKRKKETVTFPLSVFETADTKEDVEDWLLSQNPEFIKRMRKARQEDTRGKGKSWGSLKKELCIK